MEVIGGQVFPEERIRDHVVQQASALTNGDETTILAAAKTGFFHDLCMIACHNDSDAAVTINVRDVTAGTVRMMLTIPAAEAKSWIFYTPFKQDAVANVWTADMGDYTNTTISTFVQAVRKK